MSEPTDREPAPSQTGGDPHAALLCALQHELRRLAGWYMRGEKPGHTLQPTALVNEAYLRLAGDSQSATDRHVFLGLAARAMRQVLVDHARGRGRAKRGGGEWQRITLSEVIAPTRGQEIDALELHDLLEKLARIDARTSRIAELRLFGGLGIDDIAAVLDISDRTVDREWFVARAWLARHLNEDRMP